MQLTRRASFAAIALVIVVSSSGFHRARAHAASATQPAIQVDPYWPKELPNDWMLGHVVGISIDSKNHIWVTHRPNSSQWAAKTPPVIEFDQAGNVLQSWGGPGPGYEWGTQVHGI